MHNVEEEEEELGREKEQGFVFLVFHPSEFRSVFASTKLETTSSVTVTR